MGFLPFKRPSPPPRNLKGQVMTQKPSHFVVEEKSSIEVFLNDNEQISVVSAGSAGRFLIEIHPDDAEAVCAAIMVEAKLLVEP